MKLEPLHLKLHTMQCLTDIAQDNGVSLSQYVQNILDEHIKDVHAAILERKNETNGGGK